MFAGLAAACGDPAPTGGSDPDATALPRRDAHTAPPAPDDAEVAPEPDAAVAPAPDVSVAPDPDAAIAPDPDAAIAPDPDAAVAPDPDAAPPEPDAFAPPPPDAFIPPTPDGCASGVEVCNGLDDNCNGEIDEGIAAPLGDRQFGVCAGAVRLCAGEAGFVEPDYAERPGYEAVEVSCDGLDNDCDGAADFGLVPPPAINLQGLCAGLSQLCIGEFGWVDPDPGPVPGYEFEELTCDGLDNDCDGETDEALPEMPAFQQLGVCAGALQLCNGGEGMVEPDYFALPDYEGFETRCDGLDNDCDGLVDEDLVPPPAAVQAGLCAGAVQRCEAAAGWQEPDYAAVVPGFEGVEATCNGLDDDCDGATDEDLTPPAAQTQAGLCAGAVQRCDAAAGWQEPDYAAVVAGFEAIEQTCNGMDDDCDGDTDEELTPPAALIQAGLCAGAVQRCDAAAGWQEPDYAAVIAGFEAVEATCNGLDDDCDGDTDEDLTPPAADLTEGVCAGQVQVCTGDRGWLEPDYAALADYQVIEFACDALDNDCDGVVDAGGGPSGDHPVTQDLAATTAAALAWDGLSHGLAFLDARSGVDAVWFAQLDVDGVPVAPERRITPDGAAPKEPAIATSGGAFAVVYRDTRAAPRGELYLTMLDPDGAPLGPEQRIVGPGANLAAVGNPRIVWTGAEFGVAYTLGPDLNGRASVNLLRLAADGTPIGPPTVVSGLPNLVVPGAPTLAFGAGLYGITWHDARAGNVEVFFARADAEGAKIGNTDLRLTNAARSSGQPRIAFNGETFGVAFSDGRDGFGEMYFTRVTPQGAKLGAEARITHTRVVDDFQFLRSALAALDDGVFVIVSADTRAGAPNAELWVSRLAPDGTPLGPETRVTNAAGVSTLPAVAATGDTVGVAFTDDRTGNAEIHFARSPFGCP
jgi:hypothetical protein